jgi:hypothetical protein
MPLLFMWELFRTKQMATYSRIKSLRDGTGVVNSLIVPDRAIASEFYISLQILYLVCCVNFLMSRN